MLRPDEYLFTVEEIVCTELNGSFGLGGVRFIDDPYLRVFLQESPTPVVVLLLPCRPGDRSSPKVSVKTANAVVRYEVWEHDGDTIGGDLDAYAGRSELITLETGQNVSQRTNTFNDWSNDAPGNYDLTVSLTRLCECRQSWWGTIVGRFTEWWHWLF